MKFSENWLREQIDLPVSGERLVEQLNLHGLEVDGVEPAAPAFSNVVVGEIVEIKSHPDADRLRICSVDAGQNALLQIVCGASNAAKGMKAPLALPGAELPGGLIIKKGKLRGVESGGMLCSEVELGLAEKADGLMVLPADAPVGKPLREYLSLDDHIIEVDLTPNRGDCLSLRGIARELAVANRIAYTPKATEPVTAQIKDAFPVKIETPEACPRYAGRVIRGIDPDAETPFWMVERLRRSGVRSIAPVVDITNYVMLEIGQPMHAFDLAKLNGGIVVRQAKQGEKLLLLDGGEIQLQTGSLVIADKQNPCALAGIMGGELSAVSSRTQDIFLESAFFAPAAISGWPRRYARHTDSSHRFERGVDPELQSGAIEYATRLILEIAGGQPGPVIDVISEKHIPGKTAVILRRARIEQILGCRLDDKDIERILGGLGILIQPAPEGWRLIPPSHRFDLTIEVDFIEELARVYGYDHLPRRTPAHAPEQLRGSETDVPMAALRATLIESGYQEIVTYSFVDPVLQKTIEPDITPLALSNPISSELSVMRSSLMTGLLNTLKYNLHRQQKQLNIFETGLRFISQATEIKQETMIAGLRYGARDEEAWHTQQDVADFYDIKGDVERLLAAGGYRDYAFKPGTHPALHPGQTAEVWLDKQRIGYLGAVHPRIENTLDIAGPAYVFELALAPLLTGIAPAFQPVSRYPGIRRDIAIVVDNACSWSAVQECIRKAAPEYLRETRLFDVYTGKGVTPGRKSFAMGLILQEISRTLTDDEVESAVSRILKALYENLSASLRE